MLVKDLLRKIDIISDDNREVKGISFKSKEVRDGYIFVARKGNTFNGNDYIKEAFTNGAICVVSDSLESDNIYLSKNINRDAQTLIKNYYDLSDIKLIGVTGTNGKTSTCHLIYESLNSMKKRATYIGTLGVIDNDYKLELDNTTPEIDVLAREIDKAKKRGSEYIVMEVSSHSLSLNRVDILDFDVVCFTNLSQDHLDYYKNMEDYFRSKKLLFDRASDRSIAIVNNEDIYCDDIIKDYKGKVIRYGNKGDYEFEIINNSFEGISFKIDNQIITSKLLFKTNIYNLVVSYLVLKYLGFDPDEIRKALDKSNVINGRSEVLYNKGFYIILDYAHTPDAMERILLEVNKIKQNRVITLFGCGGNRDKSKRKIMGYISTLNSDKVYVSNDNPRFENEDDIISDIISISNKEKITIIKDREKAISEAINELENGDVLLILGKGHEEYQIIKDKKYHLSDREIVNKCLEN